MSSEMPSSVAAPSATLPAAPGFVFTDAKFTALVAALKGQSPVATVVGAAQTAGEDVIARMKAVIADAEGAAGHVHGAAKALQADVKANWPLLLIGAVAVAGFVLHFVKVFGFGG